MNAEEIMWIVGTTIFVFITLSLFYHWVQKELDD